MSDPGRLSVTEAAAALVARFGSGDVAGYFAAFAEDATFVFHTTQQRLGSRAAYEQLWAEWVRDDDFRVVGCRSSNGYVQDFGDSAIFCHDVETTVSTSGGTATMRERETIVFHWTGDRWLAVHEHLSADPGA